MSTLTEAVCSILNALYIRLDELPYAHDVFEEHLRTSQFIQLCVDKEEGGVAITATDDNDVELEFYFADDWCDLCLIAIESVLASTYVMGNYTDYALDVFNARLQVNSKIEEWLDVSAVLTFSDDNTMTYIAEDGAVTIELEIDPDTIDDGELTEFVNNGIQSY